MYDYNFVDLFDIIISLSIRVNGDNLKENYECENKGFEKINKFCKLYEKKNCMKNFEDERMGKGEQVLNYG